jgi:Tfp pilus assembly protein PilF
MPSVSQLALQGIFPLDDPTNEGRTERLEAIAERYELQAVETAGATGAGSWNRSGAIWLRLNSLDRAEAAFSNALPHGGLYSITANNGLASIAVSNGNMTEAISHLSTIAEGDHGSMSETALINISRVARQSGDLQAAKTALEQLISRFPESSNLERVTWELQTVLAMTERG